MDTISLMMANLSTWYMSSHGVRFLLFRILLGYPMVSTYDATAISNKTTNEEFFFQKIIKC